ncbi:alpha/beta fold hydrolase [Gloeobacter kilaueensis]|uniref:Alpha/beta hydrolase fold protein n=1 Tax=Gloeobacter kilaueensis (strain ATCC BAA-2537 / CCAP 1431/1 / ULC 316 / JS1) TaxID=1183438 RepID=U5QF68_GLOK1|nr:alpha/beta hydrolase [Gloeobacter kilaueensis]AGY56269.1 alpha/beta hydrolase fold protein [Gloeobacter kilaueensis JS1]
MEQTHVEANGIRFHCVQQGLPGAPLVLLLHGFPEFWYAWRYQIPVLAEHFWVVAPDLRGYNLSDKPAGGYDLATLSADIRALIAAFGYSKAHVVGHDWGGLIAWEFAYRYPDALDRLVVLNAPHPVRFVEELRSNPLQLFKSLYIFFFQLPWLPEQLIAHNDYEVLEQLFRHPEVRPGSFSDADIQVYRQALAVPGALSAALRYYRELLQPAGTSYEQLLAAPALVIWGSRDFALETRLSEKLERFFVSGPKRVLLRDCSHWVQQEDPGQVNALLIDFLVPTG